MKDYYSGNSLMHKKHMLRLFYILYLIQKVNHPAFSSWGLFITWLRIKWSGFLFKLDGSEFRTSLFGIPWKGTDSGSVNFLFQEVFLDQEYFIEEIPENSIIFDCGSNIGASIFYFKKISPNAQIFSFEANPNIFEILQENISSSGFQSVRLHPVALYNEETELTFYLGSKDKNLTGSILEGRGGGEEIKVPTQKLSTYFKEFEKIDVVKIDVEGAEWHILEDLISSECLEKVDRYLIEYHLNMPDENGKLSKFLKEFEERGYQYSIKAKYYKAGDFQDLLIHFVKK